MERGRKSHDHIYFCVCVYLTPFNIVFHMMLFQKWLLNEMSIISFQHRITHLLEWSREDHQHHALVRLQTHRTHSLLVAVPNGADTLSISYKIKHTLTVAFSCHTLRYSNDLENVRPNKKMHKDVYSSFIHNYQNWKATKTPFHSAGE